MNDWRDPIHPGEILADELEEIGMKPVELANHLGVPDNRIYQILHRQRSITADTALRLGRFFSTGPEFWLDLQKAYELEVARRQIGDRLEGIAPYRSPEAPAIETHIQ
jgi:addiction module HigA family antidote